LSGKGTVEGTTGFIKEQSFVKQLFTRLQVATTFDGMASKGLRVSFLSTVNEVDAGNKA